MGEGLAIANGYVPNHIKGQRICYLIDHDGARVKQIEVRARCDPDSSHGIGADDGLAAGSPRHNPAAIARLLIEMGMN